MVYMVCIYIYIYIYIYKLHFTALLLVAHHQLPSR